MLKLIDADKNSSGRRITRGPHTKAMRKKILLLKSITSRKMWLFLNLLGEEFFVQVGHEGVLVVVADGQRGLVIEDDVILLDLAYFF